MLHFLNVFITEKVWDELTGILERTETSCAKINGLIVY